MISISLKPGLTEQPWWYLNCCNQVLELTLPWDDKWAFALSDSSLPAFTWLTFSLVFFRRSFFPISETILILQHFAQREKILSVSEKWGLLKSWSCHCSCGHIWSLLTYFCSWWLISELILKDRKRQKVPTSTAATEIRTKPFFITYNTYNFLSIL